MSTEPSSPKDTRDTAETTSPEAGPDAFLVSLFTMLALLVAAELFYRDTSIDLRLQKGTNYITAKRLEYETLGGDWLTPHLFRLGASSLLNDVLMQLRMQATGRYQRPDDFTVD